jgi:hypothetical protein
MSEFYHSFKCRKVMPLVGTAKRKCPSCGDEGGKVLPQERVKQGLEAGVYHKIDPNTGKRAKKKR